VSQLVIGGVVVAETRHVDAYQAQCARDAHENGYGDVSYADYLEAHALELHAKGVEDALTRSLGSALQGNEGA
jgi:hypothetical protein